MKNRIILLLIVLLCSSLMYAIPWPISPSGSTHSLHHSYGDYHNPWIDASSGGINFHYGIDIADPYPLNSFAYEPVHAVYGGTVTYINWDAEGKGWGVILDDQSNPGYGGNGWLYGHIQGVPHSPGDIPMPCDLNDQFSVGEIVGYIAHVYNPDPQYGRVYDHLHLMRVEETGRLWNSALPGVLNPLFYLIPAPVHGTNFDWAWTCSPDMSPPISYCFFALPQYEALGTGSSSWRDRWNSVTECQNEVNDFMLDPFSGNIDLFLHFYLEGEGDFGTDPVRHCIPQRLEWWLERELLDGIWNPVMGDGTSEYRRYMFDFGDIELGGAEDSDAYQQLYFRYSPNQMISSTMSGYLCCLTNVSDASSWNSIDNIEENYWQTDLSSSGSGTAASNQDAMFPDGNYRIRWKAYAFDGTESGVEVSPGEISGEPHPSTVKVVSVDNFQGHVTSTSIVNVIADQVYWDAGWEVVETTDDYTLEFMINTDESTLPIGQSVNVEIHFSESMNPNSYPEPTIVLKHHSGYYLPMTGNWSSATVENDTWTGIALVVTTLTPGQIELLVSCQDMAGNWLMDPADPGLPFEDNYHGFEIAFGVETGWPVFVHDEVLGSPKLADVDGDGDLDVVIQSADGWIDVLDDDGSSMSGWPVSGGWSSGNPDVHASPVIVNLTGAPSSVPEILAVHPYGCNGFTSTGSAISPWSGILAPLFRWNALCSPLAGDFNGDGVNEYALGRQVVQNVVNGVTFLARKNDGSSLWLTVWGEDESVSATPSLCDVDGDDDLEILVVTDWTQYPADSYGTLYCLNATTGTEEWSTSVGGTYIRCAVVTGNLDADDALEIVIGASSGSNSIKVLNGSDGNIQYSKAVDGPIYAGASIADIDGNGDNDIVLSSSGGMLYCWDGPTGSSLSSFPLDLNTWTDDGVSIGDIDSDGMLELVIAGKDGKLHVINHDGSSTGGFPITVSGNPLSGQPALGDIDGDGRLEILFGELNNSVLHCYEMADNSACTYLPWPQFQHDAMNTGCFLSDNTAPGAPSNLTENHTYNGDRIRVYLSWTASPDDPGDVISYRIYREIFNTGVVEMIGIANAGITSYEDMFWVYPDYAAVQYHVIAWDGLNESSESNSVKFRFGDGIILSNGCPVREITQSEVLQTSHSLAVLGGVNTSLIDPANRSNCGLLTDGYYDVSYTSSNSSDCVEIDLGYVSSVSDVIVIRAAQSMCDSHRFELSNDGRTFSSVSTGRARYVRVYGATGATEIEVIGYMSEEVYAPVEIQKVDSDTYRILAPEGGSPLMVTVYDLTGRTVWSSTSSTGEILWNRCNSTGKNVPYGIYLLMVESDDMEPFTSKVIVR